jgi:hypothetical protein
VTPHDRRHRLRPDAERVALVDVGAVGGDATEDVLGDRYRRHFAAGELTLCWLTPLITSCKVLGQPSRPEFSGWRDNIAFRFFYL